ncbi:MAG: ABC transporter permease [Anaerolineae bacterium]
MRFRKAVLMPLPEEPQIGKMERLVRFIWLVPRILSILALVVGIVFLVALLVTLGQAEGRMPIQEGLRTAAQFTAEYLAGLLHGDLGVVTPRRAAATPTPVIEELGRTLPKSLGLLLAALVLATVVGLPLGILAATKRGSRLSGLLIALSTLGISTPSYFTAMLLITLAVRFYTATGLRILPVHGFGWDTHLILPALVLSARPLANMVRLTYNSLTDILTADYVRTAHGKGLGPWAVLFRHVLHNGAVPLLTTVGVSLRFSLAMLPIVEYIFTWPGIGVRLLRALQASDTVVVVGLTLALALLFILVDLILEISYRLVDPRVGAREAVTA